MDRKYDVITLGEILLRLSTPINGRLAQGDTLMKHLGGAELNIASRSDSSVLRRQSFQRFRTTCWQLSSRTSSTLPASARII